MIDELSCHVPRGDVTEPNAGVASGGGDTGGDVNGDGAVEDHGHGPINDYG
jgi:hypothetical protein